MRFSSLLLGFDVLTQPELPADLVTIKTGKNAGQHPSVASLYRALADNDA